MTNIVLNVFDGMNLEQVSSLIRRYYLMLFTRLAENCTKSH